MAMSEQYGFDWESCDCLPNVLEEAKVEGYSWHCNRHTFASRLVMARVDLQTLAELLGHWTLQMVHAVFPSRS